MEEIVIFEAHDSYVLSLVYTRDGRTLISSGMDNVIKLWDTANWKAIRTLAGHDNSVNSLDLTPEEDLLASGSSDNTVRLWSFPEGAAQPPLQDRKKTVTSVKFSPDGAWVAATSYGGRLSIWTRSGEVVTGFPASKKNLSSLAFLASGTSMATCGLGDDIHVWAVPEGELLATLRGHQTAAWGLTVIDEGRQLVSLGYEGVVRFWDTSTWQEIQKWPLEDPGVRGLLVSPDESQVALSLESRVQLRSLPGSDKVAELPISTKVVSSMAFSPDGRILAVGGADRKIRIWSLG